MWLISSNALQIFVSFGFQLHCCCTYYCFILYLSPDLSFASAVRGCVHIAADEIPYGTVISGPTRYHTNTNMAFDKCNCFINIPIKKQIVGHELESGLVQFHFSECGRSPSVCHNLGPMHKSNELWVNLSMYTIRYHFFFFFCATC